MRAFTFDINWGNRLATTCAKINARIDQLHTVPSWNVELDVETMAPVEWILCASRQCPAERVRDQDCIPNQGVITNEWALVVDAV